MRRTLDELVEAFAGWQWLLLFLAILFREIRGFDLVAFAIEIKLQEGFHSLVLRWYCDAVFAGELLNLEVRYHIINTADEIIESRTTAQRRYACGFGKVM